VRSVTRRRALPLVFVPIFLTTPIELEPDERRALRVFAFDHGVDASAVIKAVIRLLENDVVVSERVLDVLGGSSRPKA
jgi:hypothetical protein